MRTILPPLVVLLLALINDVGAHHLITSGEGGSGFLALLVSALVCTLFAGRSVWLLRKRKGGGFPARIVSSICYFAAAYMFLDFGRIPDFASEVRIVSFAAACGLTAIGIAVVLFAVGGRRANQTPDPTRLTRPESGRSTSI